MRLRIGTMIALVLAIWSGAAAAQVDMPGNDYTNFNAGSAVICRDSCAGDSRCQAFTFVKPVKPASIGQCWLKDKIPNPVRNNCCFSGTHRSITYGSLKPEYNTDRPGSDYKDFNADSVAQCQTACEDEGSCRSWTFVMKGVQGPRPHCWLKNAVALPFPNLKTVSGVKWKGVAGPID